MSAKSEKYREKPGKRGGRPQLTRKKWDAMLAAYRDVPTVQHLMDVCRVGRNTAKRAINEGYPQLGWPPFSKMLGQGSTVHRELARLNESWDDALIRKNESARQAAQEALAARIGMGSAIKAARLAHTYVAKVLEKVEDEDYEPPEITPHVIYQLVKSLETTNLVLAKALEIQDKRSGNPEHVLGSTIIDLLERCSDDELEQVIAEGGSLPPQLMGQKRIISEAIEVLPEDQDQDPDANATAKTYNPLSDVRELLNAPQDAVPPPYIGPTDPETVQKELKKQAELEARGQSAATIRKNAEQELLRSLELPECAEDDPDAFDEDEDA